MLPAFPFGMIFGQKAYKTMFSNFGEQAVPKKIFRASRGRRGQDNVGHEA